MNEPLTVLIVGSSLTRRTSLRRDYLLELASKGLVNLVFTSYEDIPKEKSFDLVALDEMSELPEDLLYGGLHDGIHGFSMKVDSSDKSKKRPSKPYYRQKERY